MQRAYRRMTHNGPSTLPCRTPIVKTVSNAARACVACLQYHFNFAASDTAAHRRSLGMAPNAFSKSNKKNAKRQLRRLAWWFELVNLSNTFSRMAIASRVLLPGSEPNWHRPATFATTGTTGRTGAFAQALPKWLSNAMVLQLFGLQCLCLVWVGMQSQHSLSSCGTPCGRNLCPCCCNGLCTCR